MARWVKTSSNSYLNLDQAISLTISGPVGSVRMQASTANGSSQFGPSYATADEAIDALAMLLAPEALS